MTHLPERLRAATARAHTELEASVDLLRSPLERARITTLLTRFHGFHQVWEPLLPRWLPPARMPRLRLPLLDRDLRTLGFEAAAVNDIAPCLPAAALGDDPASVLGSLYVLEGSTLGGRLITRHLRQAAWYPPDGLQYFDPYGDDTGARWQQTRRALTNCSEDHDRVIDGALRTFAILQHWLV